MTALGSAGPGQFTGDCPGMYSVVDVPVSPSDSGRASLDSQESLPFLEQSSPSQKDEEMGGDTVSQPLTDSLTQAWLHRPGLGLVLTFLAVVLSNLVNLMAKELGKDHVSPIQLVFCRSLAMLLLCLPWNLYQRSPPFPSSLTRRQQGLLLFRGTVGCANVLASYWSLHHLSLGNQKMLVSTRPVFVAISARVFLKETFGLPEAGVMLLMLGGVVCVVQPPALCLLTTPDPVPELWPILAMFLVLATTALSANSTVILRSLRNHSVVSLIAANQILYSLESFSLLLLTEDSSSLPPPSSRLPVLAMAALVLCQYSLTILSLRTVRANTQAVFSGSADLIVAISLQMLYYHDIPDPISWLGAALVLSAVLITGLTNCLGSQTDSQSVTLVTVRRLGTLVRGEAAALAQGGNVTK